MLNDYDTTYEDLLQKSGYLDMNLRRQKTICVEIYKTLNKLNPGYMNYIFKLRNTDRLTREYRLSLEIQKPTKLLLEREPLGATVRKYRMPYPTI